MIKSLMKKVLISTFIRIKQKPRVRSRLDKFSDFFPSPSGKRSRANNTLWYLSNNGKDKREETRDGIKLRSSGKQGKMSEKEGKRGPLSSSRTHTHTIRRRGEREVRKEESPGLSEGRKRKICSKRFSNQISKQ
jgi:hypothetical protein